MKLELKLNSNNKLKMNFTNDEVKKIVDIFKKIGLERRRISNLWGKGIECNAWIDTNNKLIEFFNNSINGIGNIKNDLNSPFWNSYYLNIAFLRLVDLDNKEIEIELDKILTIKEFKEIIELIKKVFEVIFNLVVDDVKVVFKKHKNDK